MEDSPSPTFRARRVDSSASVVKFAVRRSTGTCGDESEREKRRREERRKQEESMHNDIFLADNVTFTCYVMQFFSHDEFDSNVPRSNDALGPSCDTNSKNQQLGRLHIYLQNKDCKVLRQILPLGLI